MGRERYNQVLRFYKVQTIQTEKGKDKIVDLDEAFVIRARQTTVKETYLTRTDYPVDEEILAFSVHYRAAQRLQTNQRLEYRNQVYRIDNIQSNASYPNQATLTVKAAKRRV